MYFEVKHCIKKFSSHILYFSDAQIYMDYNYTINDITIVQIFSIENPVTIINICSINLRELT